MPKRLLSIAVVVLAILAAAGCGSSGSSTGSSTDASESTASEQFRIPVKGNPPTRTEAEVEAKWDGKGLLGAEPKPIVPKAPAPGTLVTQDLIEGKGRTAHKGDEITVQYVLADYRSGKRIEASWDYGTPFTFKLGVGEVIPGWDEGLEGMEVGAQRELVIPPELGYGYRREGNIPPGSTLVFVVDLLQVK